MNGQSFGKEVFDAVSKAIFSAYNALYGLSSLTHYWTEVEPLSKYEKIDRILFLKIEHGGSPFVEIFDGIFGPLLSTFLVNRYVLGEEQSEDVIIFKTTENMYQPNASVFIQSNFTDIYRLGKNDASIAGEVIFRLAHLFSSDTGDRSLFHMVNLHPNARTISPLGSTLSAIRIGNTANLYKERLQTGKTRTVKYDPEVTRVLYETLKSLDESGLDLYLLDDPFNVLSVLYLYPLYVKVGNKISFQLHTGLELVIW